MASGPTHRNVCFLLNYVCRSTIVRRKALLALYVQYMVDQKFIAEPMPIESLFLPVD